MVRDNCNIIIINEHEAQSELQLLLYVTLTINNIYISYSIDLFILHGPRRATLGYREKKNVPRFKVCKQSYECVYPYIYMSTHIRMSLAQQLQQLRSRVTAHARSSCRTRSSCSSLRPHTPILHASVALYCGYYCVRTLLI